VMLYILRIMLFDQFDFVYNNSTYFDYRGSKSGEC